MSFAIFHLNRWHNDFLFNFVDDSHYSHVADSVDDIIFDSSEVDSLENCNIRMASVDSRDSH